MIELLTLLAVLVIALGMVVVTARHVRSKSANELTRKRMQALVNATAALIARGIDPTVRMPADAAGLPASGASVQPPAQARERQLAEFAATSSKQLSMQLSVAPLASINPAQAIVDLGVGAGVVGPPELNDAWDRPIALFPRPDPAIGMAPDEGPFFVSAGPDGRFLTLSDNIYSYDLPALLPKPKAPGGSSGGSGPTTQTGGGNGLALSPVRAGHRE